MRFGWAKVRNVRRLSDVSLAFHPGLNLIVGDNAAGKTTLLECLQILSRGSGVRGKPASLVTHGVDRWSISASLPTYSEAEDHVRVSWIDRSMTATINDQRVGRADLARRAPVLSMSPQSHRLLEEGPGLRRRYLDWGVFHMEPFFSPAGRDSSAPSPNETRPCAASEPCRKWRHGIRSWPSQRRRSRFFGGSMSMLCSQSGRASCGR